MVLIWSQQWCYTMVAKENYNIYIEQVEVEGV